MRAVTGLAVSITAGCYVGLDGANSAGDPPPQAEGDDGGDDEDDDGDDDGEPSSDDGDDGDGPQACGDGPGISSRPMRRLSSVEYRNTLRDLLGDPGLVVAYDEREDIITEQGVRALRDDAEAAWMRRDQWTTTVPCDLQGPADEACAEAWIDQLAPRAFRRPLTDEDRQRLLELYQAEQAVSSFEDAIRTLTEAILADPELVYRLELGQPVDGDTDEIRRLDDYELASRLSYFVWDSMPDEELFDVAASGTLTESDVLAEQLHRMLEDPRAGQVMQRFAWDLLHLEDMTQGIEKDPELFPEFDADLRDAMRTEFESLVARVFEDGGTLQDLLTTRAAYVNGPLAELYGVPAPAGQDWQWVELPASERAGLLTRAAFLSAYAGSRVHSPIRRGVAVLEDVLCNEFDPPPPDVDDTPPQGSGGDDPQTVREDVIAKTSYVECTGCHSTINSVGLTFEHYDALGRWRALELGSGLPLDSSGDLPIGDSAGPVADAVELSTLIADSNLTPRCLSNRMFAAALGTAPTLDEKCAQQTIIDAFAADGDLHGLLEHIVMSDPFRFINTAAAEDQGE